MEGEVEEEEAGGFMELLDSGGLLMGLEKEEGMEGGGGGEFEESGFLLFPPSSLSSSTTTQLLYNRVNEGSTKSSTDSSLSTLSFSPSSTSTATTTSSPVPVALRGRRTNAATTKKPKKEGWGTLKVRKEKLGERITALQQLVSPFGKSDTASVLHEALGYIRFLHDQVQVLSSPYLQRLPSPDHLKGKGRGEEGSRKGDLRSRGLCLVPVSCTEDVGSCNGADFWSPAMRSNLSTSKH